MLKTKEQLVDYLRRKCETIAFEKEQYEEIREHIFEQYNIPTGTTMDMISRAMLDEQTEFVLFALLEAIDKQNNTHKVKTFFTELEIEQYLNTKIEDSNITLPIRIKCEQVTPDQWIGAVNSKFFMELRKAQMITYNANAQRVMKKIIQGENIFFKLIPNKAAIRAIKNLMEKRQYIPTSITLNIPYGSSADFYYDNSSREIVIKSLDSFDISDGYHRYLAMCELSDNNPDFSYPMEIRITNFIEDKTRQFIFQEDQKTKMSASNSNTMNTNRPSNSVIDRLNEMSTFDFKGQVGRNTGTIDYAALSDFIEYTYFKEKRAYTTVDIINAANMVKEKFNSLSQRDPAYITKILGFRELALIFYFFETESDEDIAFSRIDKALNDGTVQEVKRLKVSKALFNHIDKLF